VKRQRRIAAFVLCLVLACALIFFLFQQGGKQPSEILVLCGGSMRVPMQEIISSYRSTSGDQILLTVGGSGDLAAQIKYTRKGDIFVCHDPFMPWAEEQGLIEDWRTVAYLDPVIAVPRGNPKKIRGLEDLAQPGLRLAVGDPRYSTCGVIIDRILRQMDFGEALRANIRMTSKTHHKIATDLTLGAIDAAIVWNAVAFDYGDRLDTIPIEMKDVDAITSPTFGVTDIKNVSVTIGIITYARDRANVRRFWEYATTTGRKIFDKHGFRPMVE